MFVDQTLTFGRGRVAWQPCQGSGSAPLEPCRRRILPLLLGQTFALCLAGAGAHAATLAAGDSHSLAIKDDATVLAWGSNLHGQLGDGTRQDRSEPGPVADLTEVVAVAAGKEFSLALRRDGTVWGWGANARGQLGDGTTKRRLRPTLVTGLDNVVAIAAGQAHGLAMRANGTIWAWGRNSEGELGDGTTADRLTPVAVPGLTGVDEIAAGQFHSLAVTHDGHVWSWGENDGGQLGDGTTVPRSAPGQVPGLDSVVDVAAGRNHCLALKANGGVWSWGANGNGQLGDGTGKARLLPVAVVGLSDVQWIAAGGLHSLALDGGGWAWTWGRNADGQLGDGTTTRSRLPVRATGLEDAVAVVGGSQHSLALRAAGLLAVWGDNSKGQLGDASLIDRSSPVTLGTTGFEWRAATPTMEPPEGVYLSGGDITLRCETPRARIHYTTDGGEPTKADPFVESGGTVLVERSLTLKARAFVRGLAPSPTAGANYGLEVAAPVFAPGGGAYTLPVDVLLTTSTAGSVIHYTTDGSEPVPGTRYTGPIPIATTTLLKAKASREGWADSATAMAVYSFDFGTLAPPSIEPAGGVFVTAVNVQLSAAPGATIRFTTDGSEPTELSQAFTGPFDVTATTLLKARAFRLDWTPSTSSSASFEIQVAPPVPAPPAGAYVDPQEVAITTSTPGAFVTYTTDGSEPAEDGAVLGAGETITIESNTTLKARAWKAGLSPSGTVTADYLIGALAPPSFDPPGGLYSRTLAVHVSCPGPGLVVHYNLQGNAPAPEDPVVSCGGVVAVDHSLTLAAAAFAGDVSSDPVFAEYRIADAVSAGPRHLLIGRRNGTVVAWGDNEAGQLGNGSYDPAADPVPVVGLGNVIDVAAGGAHSLALKEDRTGWAWGANASGQLGNGATDGSPAPVPVGGVSDVIGLAAGAAHSLALRADGSVWAWGANGSGQLGNGTTTDSPVPVPVEGLTGIVQIAAGLNHNLARAANGVVWVWGANDFGQVGDGSQENRLLPVQVGSVGPVRAIAAGDRHSLAVQEDGALWGWGDNTAWQLGGEAGGGEGEGGSQGAVGGGPQLSPVALGLTSCGFDFSSLAGVQSVEGGSRHSLLTDFSTLSSLGGATASDCDQLYTSVGLSGLSVARLSAAGIRNLAVTEDGTVWYWEQGPAGPTQPFELTLPTGELRTLPPSFSLPAGTYRTEKTVIVTSTTPGSVIHFTTDGTTPDESSPIIASGGTVEVTRSTLLQAITYAPGRPPSTVRSAGYELRVFDPILTPPPESYDLPVDVSVTVETANATVEYQIDGGPVHTLPPAATIPITPPATLHVTASREGWSPSATTGEYTLGARRPVITPPGGTFAEPVTVTVTTATAGATLRFTTDGTEPDFYHVAMLSGGTLTVDRSLVLKVRAFRTDLPVSGTATATFQFGLPAPTLHATREAGGNGPFYLTAASSVAGALVRCTFGGGEPTVVSPICSRPVPIDGDVTVKATAFLVGWEPSATVTRSFSIDEALVVTPVLSLESGRYPSRRRVHIASATPAAVVRYTTTGADPGLLDPEVPPDGNVLVDRSMTLKARAFLGPERSLVARADYLLTGAVTVRNTVVALKTDGSVWAWGDNRFGEVGNGSSSSTPVFSPVQAAIDSVVAIASGDRHTVALRDDGTVWTWGTNNEGQIGNGTYSDALQPTAVDLSDVVAVGASRAFSVALRGDGTLWFWGGAAFQADPALTPRQFAGAQCVRVFVADVYVACVDPAGNTWVGSPYGSLEARPDLVGLAGVAGETDFIPLVTGGGRKGAVVAGYQQLRADLPPVSSIATNVLLAERAVPWAQVNRLLGPEPRWIVSQASPGVGVALSSVMAADGKVWRWGPNAYGQVGDGTTIARREPFAVPGFFLFADPWLLLDSDGDGLLNVEELDLGTDPWNADSNGDGLSDGVSVGIGRDPMSLDLDGDGLSNAEEALLGTNPLVADTDGDGVPDGADAFPLDPERSTLPPPNPGDTTPPDILLKDPKGAVLISTVP